MALEVMDMYRNISCLSFVILVAIQCVHITGVTSQSCTPGTETIVGPSLPDLPKSFQTNIEIKLYETGTTADATVHYDYDGNQAAVTLFQQGQQLSYIYSYSTDELFTIRDTNCTTSPLSNPDNDLMFLFGRVLVNGQPHIDMPNNALLKANSSTETYVGPSTIRGLPVNHWLSCPKVLGFASYKVDIYFIANWTTASTFPSVPLRLEVTGSRSLPNGTRSEIHHVFDFYDFLPDVAYEGDNNVFQTPSLMLCTGRKNTKPLPTLPESFYYRTEKIITDIQAIMFEDTWYAKPMGLYRRDYRTLVPEYPQFTTDALTEIHDFKTGIQYIIDRVKGNCSAYPLEGYLPDVGFAANTNFSLLTMKNPLQLLDLDWNYTYIGQFRVRGLMCDAFTAHQEGVFINDFVNGDSIVATVYFLAKEWTDVTDSALKDHMTALPCKMELLATQSLFTATFNFLDFDPEPPNIELFDIGRCYANNERVRFQIKFPGPFKASLGSLIRTDAKLTLASTMKVGLLRISDIQVNSDPANVFVTASVLDKTPAFPQFTQQSGETPMSSAWEVVDGVLGPSQCADFCVNFANFTCAMFKLCGTTCSISQIRFDIIPSNQSVCDLYLRNVKAFGEETSMQDAFGSLRNAVYKNTLKLQHIQGMNDYTAVDVQLLFGRMNPKVKLPTLGNDFQCRIETTIPSLNRVYSSQIWYDDSFKLLRSDIHFRKARVPYNTTNPLTVIEDFNTGIKYIIDRVQQNCTTTTITANDMGAEWNRTSNSSASNSSIFDLEMETPLKFFRIDDTYTFVGQQTIRGMTCNVFESIRTDFRISNHTGQVNSVFRYAFLADNWSEISDGYLGAFDQPIRLDITILNDPFYMEVNFYDFQSGHPDIGIFDIDSCFTEDQIKHVQIRFPGQYNPFLTTSSKLFQLEAVFKLSFVTHISPFRIQRVSLDYDDKNIYMSLNLVENTDHLLYFTHIVNGSVPERADEVLNDVTTLKGCADACRQTTLLTCQSFYLCENDPPQCLLSKLSGPGPNPNYSPSCSAYSRTVVGNSTIPPTNMYAYMQLKNIVYSGNLSITVPIHGTDQSKTFTADAIRDDILVPTGQNSKASVILQFVQANTDTRIDPADRVIYNTAIDDCADACVTSQDFRCRSFGYCPATQTCYIVRKHADALTPSDVVHTDGCSIYSRKYLTDYTKSPGNIQQTAADDIRNAILTDEDCARLCFKMTPVTCRSFQYCPASHKCLLSRSRHLTIPGPPSWTPCNLYLGPYQLDFNATNAGQFAFKSVVILSSVSLAECSTQCVLRQGNYCKGFYFASFNGTCFLTSSPPDDSSGHVTSSMGLNGMFCDFYTRIFFPPSITNGNITLPPFLSTTTTTAASTTSLQASSSPSSTTSTVKSRQSNTPSTRVRIQTSTQTTQQPQKQAQHQCADSSKDTGTLVGISVGTFVGGLILGALGFYLYRRIRDLHKDDLTSNLITDEM